MLWIYRIVLIWQGHQFYNTYKQYYILYLTSKQSINSDLPVRYNVKKSFTYTASLCICDSRGKCPDFCALVSEHLQYLCEIHMTEVRVLQN